MRRFLWLLPVAAALGVVVIDRRAIGQPGDDFGVLTTTPKRSDPTPAAGAGRALPAGVVPAGPAGPAAAARTAPANPYPLTADAGAWMICAAHYGGSEGIELAIQVARQLRDKHRLAAYIFNRGDEERRQQQQEWEERQKRHPDIPLRRRGVRIQDQYAVLVGGFKDFASASAFLPRVRSLPLPELKLDGGKSPYETMFYTETDENKKPVVKKAVVNPFHNAMVVRNPQTGNMGGRPKWDPFWKTLNADEEYSLLKNPHPYTLVVKEYFGARSLQQKNSTGTAFLNAIGMGGSRTGEALDAAAAQARELARFLSDRRFGFKTYVLHTRHSSVVTVGGFSGPDDPNLQRIQRQLASLRFSTKSGTGDPIGLLPTPIPANAEDRSPRVGIPVEVPRP